MLDEAEELIKNEFDNKSGANRLYLLLMRSRSQGSILSLTNFDKKIKLKQMVRTWDFTRRFSMFFKLIETFFYIIISNTQNLIYLSMMFSMYMNAGLISLVYPISIFGYALLEETRPRKQFWTYIRIYTTCLLFFKFLLNLSIFRDLLRSETFEYYAGIFKIGIYDYDDLGKLLMYMIPEILIIVFIMLNEIHLKLIGLYYQIEQDIETVNDGIQRNIERGDAEKVAMKKI